MLETGNPKNNKPLPPLHALPALSTVPKPARNIQKKSCSTLCLLSSGFEEHKLSTLVKQGLLNQLKQMVLCPEAVRQSRKVILVLSSFISISAKARCEPLKPLLFRSSIYSSLTVFQLFSIRDVCRGNILCSVPPLDLSVEACKFLRTVELCIAHTASKANAHWHSVVFRFPAAPTLHII